MKDFIYENNKGQKINLCKWPYKLNVEPIFDYEWDYTKRERRRGDIIAGFSKKTKERNLVLHIASTNKAVRDLAIDDFNSIIEDDIYEGTPGKIWIGDWYTYGYITAAKNEKWQYDTPVIKKNITLAREQESWYRQIVRKSYEGDVIHVDPEEWCKTYADMHDYQYDYMTDFDTSVELANPDVLPSNFKLSIQGAAENPEIHIGQNVINFTYTLGDGDVLVVDATNKTTIVYKPDGTQVNVFGARNADYYIFERIPSGRNTVTWNGAFNWEIILFEERSEPRWRTV